MSKTHYLLSQKEIKRKREREIQKFIGFEKKKNLKDLNLEIMTSSRRLVDNLDGFFDNSGCKNSSRVACYKLSYSLDIDIDYEYMKIYT